MTGTADEPETERVTRVELRVLERYRRIRGLLDECLALGFDLDRALCDNGEDRDKASWIIGTALTMEEPLQPRAASEEE